MIFWVTVKRVNEKRLKRLNAILECHMAGPHTLPHEVDTYIYIYIYIYIDYLNSSLNQSVTKFKRWQKLL